NAFGQPLMRMTFDYKENEHKIGRHAAQVINDIAKSMNPTRLNEATVRTQWTVVPYQSTHNTGGTLMGANQRDSALNKYLQSWDCHNLFVVGANVFPHNASYNPIRAGGRARLLDGGRDQESLPQGSRATGAGMSGLAMRAIAWIPAMLVGAAGV